VNKGQCTVKIGQRGSKGGTTWGKFTNAETRTSRREREASKGETGCYTSVE